MAVLSDHPVDMETGLPASDKGAQASPQSTDEHEEEDLVLVVTSPKLANLIYHSCNILFALVLLYFIGFIVYFWRIDGPWWMALLAVVVASPWFVLPMHAILRMRYEFTGH